MKTYFFFRDSDSLRKEKQITIVTHDRYKDKLKRYTTDR